MMRGNWSEDRKPVRVPTVKGWGEARKMQEVFPGGMVFFDLINTEGDLLDAAIVREGEGRKEFVRRVALDYEANAGAPLPKGCKLVYSEIMG